MRSAAEAGLDVVALTDHDTAQGWGEAAEAADGLGIDLVLGIEISTRFGSAGVHLLAYLPDADDPDAGHHARPDPRGPQRPGAGDARPAARGRASTSPRTTYAGWPSRPRATGRPHVADALVARGVVASRAEAFERYLNPGRPGYARRFAADLEDVVPMVVAAGGVPVVAHPWGRTARSELTAEAFARLKGIGLAGIEVDHQDHDAAARDGLARDRARARPGRHRVQRLPRRRQGRPRPRLQHHRARGAGADPRARRRCPRREGWPRRWSMSDLVDTTLLIECRSSRSS